jgi:hypothetical protein
MAAAKPASVLSYRVATRRNSLICWKRLTMRWPPAIHIGIVENRRIVVGLGRDDGDGTMLLLRQRAVSGVHCAPDQAGAAGSGSI